MNHNQTLAARAKLTAHLPATAEILRGSLLHRRIRHRSGCAVCAAGEGHLVWVLTVSYPGGAPNSSASGPSWFPPSSSGSGIIKS